jgi:hypothetical protein
MKFLNNTWAALRHEAAISNRFLPLRIYVLIGKVGIALIGVAFTVTPLWGHYGGLVEGNPWIGRLAAGFPEAVMIGLCFIPIFCGYDRTGDIADNWYYILLVAVLVHSGLIYSTAFVDKQVDKKVAKRQVERSSIVAQRSKERDDKNRANAEIRDTSLKSQAAEIQRRGSAN